MVLVNGFYLILTSFIYVTLVIVQQFKIDLSTDGFFTLGLRIKDRQFFSEIELNPSTPLVMVVLFMRNYVSLSNPLFNLSRIERVGR